MVMSEIKSGFLIIDFSSAEKKCGNRNVPEHSDTGRNNENRKKRGFMTFVTLIRNASLHTEKMLLCVLAHLKIELAHTEPSIFANLLSFLSVLAGHFFLCGIWISLNMRDKP